MSESVPPAIKGPTIQTEGSEAPFPHAAVALGGSVSSLAYKPELSEPCEAGVKSDCSTGA